MNLSLYWNISHFQVLLSIVVVLMAVYRFTSRTVETKIVGFIFLMVVLAHYAIGWFSLTGLKINYSGTAYNIVTVTAFILLYNHTLNNRYRKYFVAILVVFLLLTFFNMLFWQRNNVNTYSFALGAFILILLGVLYLYRLLIDLPVTDLKQYPMFWFNSATLIYNAGAFFLFLLADYLTHVLYDNLLIYWTVHNVFNIVRTMIFIYGMWLDIRIVNSDRERRRLMS